MRRQFWLASASAGAMIAAFPLAAHADDADIAKRLEQMQERLDKQEQDLAAQKAEIARLRGALAKSKPQATATTAQTTTRGASHPQPAMASAPASASAPVAMVAADANAPATQGDIQRLRMDLDQQRIAQQEQPVWSMTNLRPTVSTPDGRFTLSLRGLFQLDAADYFQDDAGPLSTDFRRGSVGSGQREVNSARELSDGLNFRRAQLGIEGKLWRDFNYRLVYEFGGSGTEGPARINDAYINYTGLAPFTFQIGAFLPNSDMEDATSASDTLFLERATPAELQRGLAGADGRYGAGVRGSGERWSASLFYTGGTVGDAEVADEQSALVGRAAFLAYTDADTNVHLGANTSYVFEPPDQGSLVTSNRYGIRFRDRPELRVDSTRLIDTGTIDARSAYASGLEAAANYKNFFFQSEYFFYGIERRNSTADDPTFSGFYAQASWVLTGETHRYSMATASYSAPKPMVPVDSQGGFGAWELAARYSHVDLNFEEGAPGTAAPVGSVRGGEENIWTVGVNWYLNANLRASLDYYIVDVDRLNPAGPGNTTPFGASPATPPIGVQIGQDYNAIAIRTQFAF
jgi:phosphate-selective porin OprO/OprP